MTDRVDLRGQWQVFLDPEDIGLNEQWFLPQQLAGRQAQILNLPGSLEQAGIGDTITSRTEWVGSQFGTEFVDDPLYAPYRKDDDFRFPYWLQPETRYVGPAWYVKHITLPEAEVDHWQLILERPHWETRVWVNGRYAGSNDSLCVPHRYHLDASLRSGDVILVIRVDNRMIRNVGPNAHSISDQTQGPWNGIVGELSLKPVGSVSLGEIQVYPNFKQSSALAQVEIQNHLEAETSCMLKVGSTEYPLVLQAGASRKMHVEMYDLAMYRWDEFAPNLATLHFQLFDASDSEVDQYHCEIGLRSVETQAKHIFVNGKQVFLRGTVECCVFPKTGAPPTEEEPWEEIFAQSKAFGLNHIRFHSWCPPDAAFRVADRMGFYLQVECPIWKNQGVAYGDDGSFDDWLFGESERIVCEYGNHPSFLFFASGNEPSGQDKEVLGLWASYWNQRDTRRLHTSASGWPALAENAYQVVPEPRIQAWGEGLASRINAKRPETVTNYDAICEKYPGPVVTHEMGQWCVFPDFSEMDAYTGYLKPRNFEIFADILKRRGMYGQARQFLSASGFQQVLCYKEEIEAALRTENLSGIQLLALADFPGQGTALEGVLNVFWQEKGYCTADQFRMFCNDIVLLSSMEKRTYVFGESFTPKLRIANFGKEGSIRPIVQWKLCEEDGKVVEEG
ncbi:MAG: sugar-binding domain-containing protein, partial [Sphaerochaetaceae bacterium]